MRRRDFITLLGGTAATWPLVARAQQGSQKHRVGVVNGEETDPEWMSRLEAFRKTFEECRLDPRRKLGVGCSLWRR